MKTINSVGALQLVLFGFTLAFPMMGVAAQEDRITGPIGGSRAVVLREKSHPMVAPVNDRGALDPSTPIGGIRMALKQTAAQAADLERFLEAQRDTASTDYQHWLTPEEL